MQGKTFTNAVSPRYYDVCLVSQPVNVLTGSELISSANILLSNERYSRISVHKEV